MSNIFQTITEKLYGQNPYLGFDPLPSADIRKIYEKLFDFLITSLRPKTILEVGSWKGSSAIKMAQILEEQKLEESAVICVDTWLGSPEHWLWKNEDNKEWGFDNLNIVNGFPTIYKTFLSNVVNSNLQHKIIPFPQTSENAAVIFQKLSLKFDLIYIDAAHEYKPVWRDLQAYYPLLNENGVLFGDDYPMWEGVRRAANDFAQQLNLKIYTKLGKYVLVKPGQNLVGFEIADLKQEAIKSQKELLELGLKARQQGQEQEALNYNELEALMELGNFAALKWQLEEALEKFQQVIKRHPNHLNAYVQATIQLRELTRFAEAEKMADLGLTKCLTDLDSLTFLKEKGLALAGQEKLNEASESLKKFVQLGGNVRGFFQAAVVLSKQKMFEQAILFLESNLTFIKEYHDNWIGFKNKLNSLQKSKELYESQIKRARGSKEYKILDLHPQKPWSNLPLSEFRLNNFLENRPLSFHKNRERDRIEYVFDDLGGLLSLEGDKLYRKSDFKIVASNDLNYSVLTIPKACLTDDLPKVIFSLDGYFVPELLSSWHLFQYSHQCLIKKIEKSLPCGFFLPSSGPGNYYHIICDIVPTLYAYQELNLNCPIILPSKITPIQKKVLQVLGIPKRLVMPAKKVEGIVFDLGIVCKPIPLNIEIVNFYRKIATRILEQEPINIKKSEKIYISRRNSSKRILTNEEQIEELLKKLGFDIYYMEHYTFEQQIAIMEQASIVVAPHGAGLANILFCPTGTKIVEFRIDKYPIDCFEKMSLICQHKYYPILGHLESQNASKDKSSFYWTVDADKVKKVVEKLVN